MRIGIIGSSRIGETAGRLFVGAGHVVVIASLNPVSELVRELGGRMRAGTVTEVAIGAHVIVLAVPFARHVELPVEGFGGRIVIDATNYHPGRDGSIAELDADRITSTQLIAQHLVQARVVKAFNTMDFDTLASTARVDAPREERLVLFLACDDGDPSSPGGFAGQNDAKNVVVALIEQLGFAAVDTGSLAQGGRLQQPGSAFYQARLLGGEADAAIAAARTGLR